MPRFAPMLAIMALLLAVLPAASTALASRGRGAAPVDPFARPELIYIIPVDHQQMIDLPMGSFIKRGLKEAALRQADHVVLKIDTPGGRIDVLLDLVHAIEEASKGLEITAWASGEAWSAGAGLCLACDRIYMSKSSSIGSALPVYIMPGSKRAADRKDIQGFAGKFRALAEKHGRPANLAAAMVDPELEVIACRVDGDTRYLTPNQIAALEEDGVRVRQGETMKVRNDILALSATEAMKAGFIDGIANDETELRAQLGAKNAALRVQEWTGSEHWARWLYRWNMLFLVVGLVGLFIEFKMPGFGVAGILGLAFLAIFFASAWMVGTASAMEVSLFLLGVVLVALEIFVIPGFGIAGILGTVLIFVSLLMALQSVGFPTSSYEWQIFQWNFTKLVLSLAATVIIAFTLGQYLPKTPLFRGIALQTPSPAAVRGSAAGQTYHDRGPAIGAVGRAGTTLRPAGTALFDEAPVDVVAAGGFIEAGTPVRVVNRRMNRYVVEAAEPDGDGAPRDDSGGGPDR